MDDRKSSKSSSTFGGGMGSSGGGSNAKSFFVLSMIDYDASPVSSVVLCYTQNETKASRALEDYCLSILRTLSNNTLDGDEALEDADTPLKDRQPGWHMRFIEVDVAKSPSVMEVAELFSVERDQGKLKVHRARRLQCEVVSMCIEDILLEASEYDEMFLEAPCVSCFANDADEQAGDDAAANVEFI